MKDFKYNTFLILSILIGLCAALVIDCQRHNAESGTRQADLAIDYEGLVELAEREGLPPADVMQMAKDTGITSLAVYETTFRKLNKNGKALATPGSELLRNYQNGAMADPAWRELVASGRIIGTEVYVTGHDRQTFREVKEDLIRRLGAERVTSLTVGSEEVLAVKANYEALLKMNLGMPTDEMRAVNDAGFFVLARPSNYLAPTPDDVAAVFRRMEGFEISEIVFSGKQCLGAPGALQATIDQMKERQIPLGLIEETTQLQFYKQDGMNEIAKGLGYDHVARLYSIPKDEQPKLKIDTAVERWANTDVERNIRIDLLRIYDTPAPGMTLLETNLKYFQDTHDLIASKGYTFGRAALFPNFYPLPLMRAVVMVGVAAAGVLYLSLVIPALNRRRKLQFLLFVLCALGAAVPVALGAGSKIRLLAAFASANVFPALAMVALLDRWRASASQRDFSVSFFRVVTEAVPAIFVTGLISLAGAAFLSGSLADVEYMLEFSIYRGIKLTFLLPIVLVAIAFLQRFDIFDGQMDDTAGFKEQMRRILDMPLKLKTFLLMLAVLGAGVIFVARSGHTSGMPVSGLELQVRAFLEKALYARPRSKELFIGHPAFLLAIMAWRRKWPTMVLFGLILVATIGQGSMVETFAHMRTPILMSAIRGLGGLTLGTGLGIVAMIAAQLWQTMLARARQ